MTPVFLSVEDVKKIHEHQIRVYGGASGLRDINLLRSAVGAPQSTFQGQFLHKDILEMAAAYLFSLVQNHPFVDGNKRTGAACSYTFLRLNGFQFDGPEAEFESLVLRVAQGNADRSQIADFLREFSTKN